MKKLLYFLLVSLVLVSCKDDFDISKLQDTSRLVVYSFPTASDTTLVIVTKSVPVATAKGDRYSITRQSVDAHIIYKVNGVEQSVKKIETEEDARRFDYYHIIDDGFDQQMIGQYYVVGKQKKGDNITLEVSADGFPSVSAATYIPQSVKIGIDELSFEKVSSDQSLDNVLASFIDDGASKDYYSVMVQKNHMEGEVVGVDEDGSHYVVGDVEQYKEFLEKHPNAVWSFNMHKRSYAQAIDTDKEPVLTKTTKLDEDLGFDEYGYYGLSYIFDDHLLNGKRYTLHLSLASTYYTNNYYYTDSWDKMFGYAYIVELYKLTPEYYRYLSSINSAQSNSWAEAGIMQVTPTYSNVKGGFGVVAGYSVSADSVRIEPSGDVDNRYYAPKHEKITKR